MPIDCNRVVHLAFVKLKDYYLIASLAPVALDTACIDIIFNMTPSEGNDNSHHKQRISSRHSLHSIEHTAKIGLGSINYEIVNIN